MGAAFVVVTGLGEYCGSVKVSFQIVQKKEQQIKKLKRPSIKKLSSAKRGTLTVKFGRTAGAKKYVVQIARNKKFTKGSRKKTVRSCKKVCFKKLKRGVKYYVRVRAYQGSRRSAYSKVKSKKIK